MESIDVAELAKRADEIVRAASQGANFEILLEGRPVARLTSSGGHTWREFNTAKQLFAPDEQKA